MASEKQSCSIKSDTSELAEVWLREQMSPYFFQAMADEPEAMRILARELSTLCNNRRLILADRDKRLIMACVDRPGSLYESMQGVPLGDLSYAMFSHSNGPMPGHASELEVQRFEFDRKPAAIIENLDNIELPVRLVRSVMQELSVIAPDIVKAKAVKLLKLLWLNKPDFVVMSPPVRIAWFIWLFERANSSGGLFFDLSVPDQCNHDEARVLFAVGNPPQEDFLQQVTEVFNRLNIGIRRAYCLTITNGVHPYFLATFIVRHRAGETLTPDSLAAIRLERELCTTQILDNDSYTYREWVTEGIMAGDDAALINAFIGFCHTNLAHNQPERFGLDDVSSAFHSHPEIACRILKLFRVRFDPEVAEREKNYQLLLAETQAAVADYNTGHRWLDELRRTVYGCCLSMVTHMLKTNFFVSEKQALAFRLDPVYLRQLGHDFTADLPETIPFRVTYFFSRFGQGYHIGFSDIARGGWRTVIARNQDDLITASNGLFREVYVLAHTQHLKNKDIYEGGSKMVVVLDATDIMANDADCEKNRLYKLQYGIANAFLDLFISSNGKMADQRIVDYYGDDEPIELGPDENMHDGMVEAIAALSRRRGYMLGIGIISSKRVGINHKEYGVTSTGVISFAGIAMQEIGVDIRKDPFKVKMTGGPGGDVAGNCLRLFLEQSPCSKIVLVLDGTAAAYDPLGLDHKELQRITLRHDLDVFDPECLNIGGVLLLRNGRKQEGFKELHCRFERLPDGTLEQQWVHLDDFYREYSSLIFRVEADLFIPAGGRPETIDAINWRQFLLPDGRPSARVIVEGANSFITPEARAGLQRSGVVLMRDSSANKCGVISSSYEVIANLLLSENEFVRNKERYVKDVLAILSKRAADEASLIIRRHHESKGTLAYTEISEQISQNINSLYHRLFMFFCARQELCSQQPFKRAIMRHLPAIFQDEPRFRNRVDRLLPKYLAAVLAAEIATSMVYSCNRDTDFEEMVRRHLARIDRQPACQDTVLPLPA